MLLPAFKVGVYDGLNPCGMASALIFVMFFSRVGHLQRRVFWLGLLFIISSFVTHFNLTIGVFDPIVTTSVAVYIFRVYYFLLAAGFLIYGTMNIIDRFQYNRHSDPARFKCRVPVFLNQFSHKNRAAQIDKKRNFILEIKLAIVTIIVGFLVALCSSIYPQREYIFIVYSYLMAGGNEKFAFLSFFQYSVALVLPLVAAWIIILVLGMVRAKEKAILYYKDISAALFLSVSIGLACFLFT